MVFRTVLFSLVSLILFSGCISDVIISKDELSYEGGSNQIFNSKESVLKVYVHDFQDLRENKENIVGSKAGLNLVFPFYQQYKVEGHPPGIVRQFISEKLRSMGFDLVFDDSEAQATLHGSLKEFSRNGWGASLAWGNSSRIVLDLAMIPTEENESSWEETLYGEGDDLNESLNNIANALGTNSRLKNVAAKIASGSIHTTKRPPPDLNKISKKHDSQPPLINIISPMVSRNIKIVSKASTLDLKGTAEDVSGISEITVNGQPITFSKKGEFSTQVSLHPGKNSFLITAKDTAGNLGRKTVSIERTGLTASARLKDGKYFGNYFALVIGNNNYNYLPKLETPHNDVHKVAQVLEDRYGFHTQILLDAKRDDIMEKLNTIRSQLNENDNLLIYYAGHGFYDRATSKAYWQPVDAHQNSDAQWIIVDSITSNIKRTSSKHILIVADSCYSGAMTRSGNSRLGPHHSDHNNYIKKMQKKTSRTLMSSGGNEPVIDGGGGRHSIFAAVFIESLQSMEREIFTTEELFYEHIKESVAGQAEQTPEYSTIRNSGHDGGDFIFHNRQKK